ncbi:MULTISPECIES: DUF4932 domain-containing protein [Flavobacterium]|uniref:DUF4932 domain-containing protein n=1 Tax=Flavobacterium hankyongi TaxID=1176532 RepID=A0ABP9A3Z7_9FLAO|nr:DUF4932 domain-containing protein [Flavobacterium sp. N1846]
MKKIFLIITILFLNNSFSQKSLEVRIDKRVEAITIFYTLATRDTLDVKPTPSSYYKDFDSYFEKYKNHESLNWYRNLEKWDAYDVSSLGLYLSDKYPFKLVIPYNETHLKSSELYTFLSHLNKFYKECEVEQFIKNHKNDYLKIETSIKKSIEENDILLDVKKFYNKPTKHKLIVLPDLLNAIINNAIVINDKKYSNYRFIKLAYLKNKNIAQTNETEVNFIPLPNVVIHEISHLFVQDFIPKYIEQLSLKKNLFLTTSDDKILNEKEWKNELDELIVRTCVAKILGIKFGIEKEQKEIENQAKHYKHIKALNNFFDNYTKNREKYSSITFFYPEIIKFFEDLK